MKQIKNIFIETTKILVPLLIIFALFTSTAPVQVIADFHREGKIVDKMWLSQNDSSVVDNFTPVKTSKGVTILAESAFHLDSDRNVISDIHKDVYGLDDNWSTDISDGEYVRVVFEKPLKSGNDITIYPNVVSGNPTVEVYETESGKLIERFSYLESNKYNKVFLARLSGEVKSFDLKVVGGAVSFDHIMDPQIYMRTGTGNTNSNGALNVSFSAAMPDTNYSILLTGGTDTDSMYSMVYLSRAIGGFSIKAEDDAGGNEQATNNQWMALSYGDFDYSGNYIKCDVSGGSAGNNVVTFPSAFPNTNYAILASSIDDSDSPNINFVSGSKQTGQVTIRIEDDGGATEAVTESNYCAFSHGEYSVESANVKAGSATTAGSGNTTVNFSGAFPNTDYVVVAMAQSTAGAQCAPEIITKNTGSVVLNFEDDAGSNCASRPFDWVAITTGEFDPVLPAGSCSSTGSTAWATGSTWTAGCNGAGGIPAGGDAVTILNGHNVTVASGVSAVADDVTINNGGTLTITSSGTLAASGNFLNSGTLTGTGAITLTGAGTTIDGSGTYTLSGLTTLTNNKTISSTASLSLSGALTVTTGSTITISAGANISVAGTATVTSTGSVTNNGTFSAGGTFTGTGSWTQGTDSVLNLSGATTNANAISTFTASASGNSVNYIRNGAQTCKVVTYHTLVLGGGNTKTCLATSMTNVLVTDGATWDPSTGDPNIGGTLTIDTGASYAVGANTISVTGLTTVNGTLTINSSTGSKTFGNITISNGGKLHFTSAAETVAMADLTINNGGTIEFDVAEILNISGSVTNDGTWDTVTSATGAITMSGSTKTIGGTGAITMASLAATSLTNNGTLTVSGVLSGTTFVNGSNANLILGGNPSVTTLTATASGNTVNYGGGAQTCKNVEYYNLILSGSGTKTCGNTYILNNLTISGTASLTPSGGGVIGGNLTVGNGASFTVASLEFLDIYGDLIVGGGSSGVFTQSAGTGEVVLYGNLIINSGATWTKASGYTYFFGPGDHTITNNEPTTDLGNFFIGDGEEVTTLNLGSDVKFTDLVIWDDATLDQGANYNLTTTGSITINSTGAWINTGTGDIILGGDVGNAGTITIISNNDSSCSGTDDIVISSSDGSTQRTWFGEGTFNVRNVSASYQTGSITVYDSFDGGNNGWVFTSECAVDAVEQLHYRWRNLSGTEAGAGYLADEDTAITSGVDVGDRIRLRFLISNTSGTASDYTYQLEHASSSCSAWMPVPTSTSNNPHWVVDTTSGVSNGEATTDSSGLSNPAGTFVPGYVMTESNTTPALTLSSGQFTEIEYSIRSRSSVEVGTVYCFRLTNAGVTTAFTYTAEPQITISTVVIRKFGGGGGNAGGEQNGVGPIIEGGGSGGGGGGTEDEGQGEETGGGGAGGGGGGQGSGDLGQFFPTRFFAISPNMFIITNDKFSFGYILRVR